MILYNPILDGPAEPLGLAMDANGNIQSHEYETPTIHDKMTTFEVFNAQTGIARTKASRIIESIRELPLVVHQDARQIREHVFQLLETLAEFETAAKSREVVTLKHRDDPDAQRFHLYDTATGNHLGAFESFDTITRNCGRNPFKFAAVFRNPEGFLRVRCIKTGIVMAQPESALVLQGIVRARKRRGMAWTDPTDAAETAVAIAD